MKSSTIALTLLASSTEVLGFPQLAVDQLAKLAAQSGEKLPRLLQEKHEDLKRQAGFDAGAQAVSVTGEHAFVAPNFGAGDQRGPCPGLNAAANHGYIDHSGVDTFNNILAGVNEAYGMALDLATFLAVYGTVFDGNPISLTPGYSIGGYSPRSQNILGNALGLLGQAEGLSGSHNKYESDSSPTRPDMYLEGQAFRVSVPQAQQYVDNTPSDPISAPDWYDSLFEYRISRFDDSINRNGRFFFSPFAGVLVAPAGYSFPPAMMSNHSAEFPEGYMTKDIFKQFFSLGGADDAITYEEGHERIPENWYKRAIGDEYTIPFYALDLNAAALEHPQFLSIGGNTGKTNSFTGVDLEDLTGGLYNTQTLLEGNNLACFGFQAAVQFAPDLLKGLVKDLTTPLGQLGDALNSALNGLGCPQLGGDAWDESSFSQFPGFTKLKSDGTYA